MNWKVALIGFGHVGRGLAQVLLKKEKELLSRHKATFRVTTICTGQNGNFYSQEGLPLKDLLVSPRESTIWQNYRTDKSVENLISDRTAQIFCELSPTNLVTAEPALSRCRLILQNGLHLITANKGPVVLAGDELELMARKQGLGFFYETTVMSGSPVFSFIDDSLQHCHFLEFHGAVNGSSNYILSEMEKGQSYENALRSANENGFTEADPSLDIDGWDSTAKAIILGRRLFGQTLHPKQVSRQGIHHFPRSLIEEAVKEKQCIRLTSHGWLEKNRLRLEVKPTPLALDDPLSRATGSTSTLTIATDLLGKITITGPGAGSIETAAGVFSDLLRIHRLGS